VYGAKGGGQGGMLGFSYLWLQRVTQQLNGYEQQMQIISISAGRVFRRGIARCLWLRMLQSSCGLGQLSSPKSNKTKQRKKEVRLQDTAQW
jgi:hypothetical protein